MISRGLDILISLVGLFFLLLMLPGIALLIKLDSRGPVFYRCPRVGLNGKIFQMYKFRTMYEAPLDLKMGVSPRGDPRVTPVGRVLRRLKLNEFPQFLNVLKGDMALIGPRPESAELAAAYPAEAKRVFTVKPGLAGPNQIVGRNEKELYPAGADPVKYYIERLLPKKLPLDLEYIDNQSVFKDLKYLFLAVRVTITGAISRRHLWDNRKKLLLLLADLGCCALSYSLAHFLRYEGLGDPKTAQIFPKMLACAMLLRAPIFIYFGLYHSLIRHLSFYDTKQIAQAVSLSSLLLVSVTFFATWNQGYARGVFLIDAALLTVLLIGYRVLVQRLLRFYESRRLAGGARKRVLIFGAGDAGELCLRYLQKEMHPEYETVGFIDDDPGKRHLRLNGVKVLGDRYHLEVLSQLYRVEEVFVAIPSAPAPEIQVILEACRSLGLQTRLFQPPARAYARGTGAPAPEVYVPLPDSGPADSR
jgi:lipopolysaccharide/colanic/teichoic acid biosynthesis glycosyltransferase